MGVDPLPHVRKDVRKKLPKYIQNYTAQWLKGYQYKFGENLFYDPNAI